jgi:hypothetical protein
MSSSTKTEVSLDSKEIESRQRWSCRLNRKLPCIHSRKSFTSTEPKSPNIVKSSSSKEKSKLETLYIPNKVSPKVVKVHEDSDTSKNKSSHKYPFGIQQNYPQDMKSDLMQ